MKRFIQSILFFIPASIPIAIGIGTGLVLFSCEEIIDPTLRKADPVLVVDAWLNNKEEDQVIKLTTTQPYLTPALPEGVSDASVTLVYDGGSISFTEDAGEPGTYRWPYDDAVGAFDVIGRAYTLTIVADGITYEATSRINRTVTIDSITFKLDTGPFYPDNTYFAEFWATDSVGKGDTYWIRTYKNGVLLNKPSEINIAYDAAFNEGGNFDGITFLSPIRSVNPNDVDDEGFPLSPYVVGDSVYVEVHSITHESFNFLNEVMVQTNRPGGFGELFAVPLANVSSNIRTITAGGPKAIGFFNVAAVGGFGKKLEL